MGRGCMILRRTERNGKNEKNIISKRPRKRLEKRLEKRLNQVQQTQQQKEEKEENPDKQKNIAKRKVYKHYIL